MLVLALVIAVGCGCDPPGGDEVAGVTARLVITRQRDLLDRGLINVEFQNDSTLELTVHDRRLVATGFDIPAAPDRTSRIPNTRPVHLQVPYGEATECGFDATTARLDYTYTTAAGEEPVAASVEVTGTELLDGIRAEQCAQGTFDDLVEASFGVVTVDEEAATVDLVLERRSDGPAIEVRAASGTILVGAELIGGPVALPGEVGDAVDVTIVFVVNRCDPHAMAEVTRRYGLTLDVSLDGDGPNSVDVPIGPVTESLETIVEACRRRTAAEQ